MQNFPTYPVWPDQILDLLERSLLNFRVQSEEVAAECQRGSCGLVTSEQEDERLGTDIDIGQLPFFR